VTLLDVGHRVLLVFEDASGAFVVELVVAGHLEHAAVRREVAGEDLDRALRLIGVVDRIEVVGLDGVVEDLDRALRLIGIVDRIEVVGLDGVVVGDASLAFEVFDLLGDGAAGDGHRIAVEQVGIE